MFLACSLIFLYILVLIMMLLISVLQDTGELHYPSDRLNLLKLNIILINSDIYYFYIPLSKFKHVSLHKDMRSITV
jgi:hypothetical protein